VSMRPFLAMIITNVLTIPVVPLVVVLTNQLSVLIMMLVPLNLAILKSVVVLLLFLVMIKMLVLGMPVIRLMDVVIHPETVTIRTLVLLIVVTPNVDVSMKFMFAKKKTLAIL